MDLSSINLVKLTDSQLIKLNKKLPWPKQEIVGHVSVLPVTIAMGCQIHVIDHNDPRMWLMTDLPCFQLDFKKISFPCLTHNTSDSTDAFLKVGGDYFCIGSASLAGKYPNHADHFYSPQFFGFREDNFLSIPLNQRKGWCCTMSKSRPMRNLIAKILNKKNNDEIFKDAYFCYDGIDPKYEWLIGKMFRKPGSESAAFIETADGIDDQKANHWGDLRFINQNESENKKILSYRYSYELYPQRIKNQSHTNIAHLLGPWHKKNIIELVPEATPDYFEPTEKIVKPMRAGMPFVVMGCRKFLYRLRKMGFKTFHPWIDERYDLEKDWRKRVEMATDAALEFSKHRTNLFQIERVCEHNQQVLAKIGKHNYPMRIAKKLKRFISF